jgi:hypothetical protein
MPDGRFMSRQDHRAKRCDAGSGDYPAVAEAGLPRSAVLVPGFGLCEWTFCDNEFRCGWQF